MVIEYYMVSFKIYSEDLSDAFFQSQLVPCGANPEYFNNYRTDFHDI